MILLDEQFPESQRQLLKGWRISVRQVGRDIGRSGMKDDEIIPLLLQLRRPTFFTLDYGFYKRTLCHSRYCLVCLDLGQYEAASFVRRTLAHDAFNTEAKRLGSVVRITHVGLNIWRVNAETEEHCPWR